MFQTRTTYLLIIYLQIYKKMLDCLQDYKKTINFAQQITFVEKGNC